MARSDGTLALRALHAAGVPFVTHEFDSAGGDAGYGIAAAEALRVDPARVFKTLVVLADGVPVLAIVLVTGMLSLRQLAVVVGAKRAEMCPIDRAERLTGSVAGGISPFGQKRTMVTVIDETCVLFDTIFVSGGRRGLDVEVAPDDLVRMLDAVIGGLAAA
jgi:Cys-tRNA(Pro)/Cys-tRNA(Cys) deacylase